jgi:hypothetical protein
VANLANAANFVVNLLFFKKLFHVVKILASPKKFFEPLKWYTVRKFFGDPPFFLVVGQNHE